jgi:hypothetical protein
MLFLEDMERRMTFIALDAEEYWAAIADATKAGVVGGLTYDAQLGRCALKAKAETIYTWNVGHFQQLGTNAARLMLIRTP